MAQRRFRIEWLLLFAGILAPILAFEIAVRCHAFEHPAPHLDRPLWYYIPEGAGSDRDYPYSIAKPADAYRIVVVGDSFTFGDYVQIDDTFSKRLERMLNLNQIHEKAEVIIYAKDGFSTFDEIALVKQAAQDLSADLILLQITLNDPELVPYRLTHKAVFEEPDLSNPIFSLWQGLGFVVSRIHNTRTRREHDQYYFRLFNEPETWNRFVGALQEMKKIVDTHSIPMRAVIFPLFNQPLDSKYPFKSLHQKIRAQLKDFKIPALDLLRDYRKIPIERLEVIPGTDGHPNEIAHRIAAETIYEWLKRQRAIPKKFFATRRVKFRNIYDPFRLSVVSAATSQ